MDNNYGTFDVVRELNHPLTNVETAGTYGRVFTYLDADDREIVRVWEHTLVQCFYIEVWADTGFRYGTEHFYEWVEAARLDQRYTGINVAVETLRAVLAAREVR